MAGSFGTAKIGVLRMLVARLDETVGLAMLCLVVPRLRDCASATGIAHTPISESRISALQRRCALMEELICFFMNRLFASGTPTFSGARRMSILFSCFVQKPGMTLFAWTVSSLFEMAHVLVRLDHIASRIVNANHGSEQIKS